MTSYGGAIGVPVDADNIGRDVLVGIATTGRGLRPLDRLEDSWR